MDNAAAEATETVITALEDIALQVKEKVQVQTFPR